MALNTPNVTRKRPQLYSCRTILWHDIVSYSSKKTQAKYLPEYMAFVAVWDLDVTNTDLSQKSHGGILDIPLYLGQCLRHIQPHDAQSLEALSGRSMLCRLEYTVT